LTILEKYSAKEEKAQELIDKLRTFIKSFKGRKRKFLLEGRYFEWVKIFLMQQKKGFIKKVAVDN